MHRRVLRVITPEFILLGAALAIAATTLDPHWYHQVIESSVARLPMWLHGKEVNLHFLANEVLMCLFFLVAAKEVREELLPNGALYGVRRAALPLLATSGGVIGPAVVYIVLAKSMNPELANGWVVPTATDIAFAFLAARLLFGEKHGATSFLLTLAVIDDAVGLALIPTMYSEGVQWLQFGLLLVYMVGATVLLRGAGVKKWYYYFLVAGVPGWLGFMHFGVEPAMALVPIVAGMPHAHNNLGWFRAAELERHDALNEMEHALKPWLGVILLLFGFTNTGIQLDQFGAPTVMVLVALVVGKFAGIVTFTNVCLRFGLQLPDGMTKRHIPVLAAIACIGFTVAIFVAGVAFSGDVSSEAKLGAFLSLPVGVVIACALATSLRVARFARTNKQEHVVHDAHEPQLVPAPR